MSYLGHSFRESYSSVKMKSVYSTVPVNWANLGRCEPYYLFNYKLSSTYPSIFNKDGFGIR